MAGVNKDPETTDNPNSPEWLGSLGDDLKGNASLQKFNDVGGLAKSYVELEKTMGNKIKIPGEDSTDEERNAFYTKLGRPEVQDAYEFDQFDSPEGMSIPEGYEKSFKELAFKQGLNKTQAKEFDKFYKTLRASEVGDLKNNLQAKLEATTTELKQEWGANFEKNTEYMNRALKRFFPTEEAQKILNTTGLGVSAEVQRGLFEIGKSLGEDSFKDQNTGDGVTNFDANDFTFDY